MPKDSTPHPLDGLIGARRPLGIGIAPSEFRAASLPLPPEVEVEGYSLNPRNRYGDWYEARVALEMDRLVQLHPGWQYAKKVNVGWSEIYQSNKVVDMVVSDMLGLELKFLKGTGSLVGPKSVIDAIDFTKRSVYCLYVIDGPGWLEGRNVEYLHRWWDFTCVKHLETTISRFFAQVRSS